MDPEPARTPAPLDVLITGATVIDGTGREGFVADVGIRDGHVVALGPAAGSCGARDRLAADGLVLAPGFIELHSHADPLALREAESSLRQGVTTEILNPDGFGTEGAPWVDTMETPDITRTLAFAAQPPGIAVNIGAYVGLGAVWAAGAGLADERPDAQALHRMRELVLRAMAEGAWGVSAGLYYPPSAYGTTEEVVAVVSAAAPWRVPFSNHVRNEGSAVLAATVESLEIAERAGLVGVIAHMKAMGPANWGATAATLQAVADARARGLRAAGEVYPYLSSRTGLSVLVPPEFRSGGDAAMVARFTDAKLRPQVAAGIERVLYSRVADARSVHLEDCGLTLGQYCAERAVGLGDAVMTLLEQDPQAMAVYDFGHEADLERILRRPFVAVASDGGACLDEHTHPRNYGTQPRVLARYVRDRHLLTLPQAVRRMTGLPASVLGMTDRGLVAPGTVADLVLFDPVAVRDRATYEQPRQYAEGVAAVLLAGVFAMRDGALTGARAGQVLRRPPYAVSDPDTGLPQDPREGAVQVVVAGSGPAGTCEVELHGPGHGTAPQGRAVLRTPDGRVFTASRLGCLRAGTDWAVLVGVGGFADGVPGEEIPFRLTAQTGDPRHQGRPTLAWEVRGGPTAYGPLLGAVTVTGGG
ncbi:amidohydrolase family protein [Streptomyces sp. NPDC021093]|uniref:amidohydrolase family protein n=1 Tax=Streptomyces sp. NPDC021093 TaxID=3365112 RepID=UPI00378E25E2